MRVVVQRVSHARVFISGRTVGEIDVGLLLLIGFSTENDEAALDWMVEKIATLRIFSDADGKMNHSVEEIRGSLLAVSQFTLYGDTRKGRRPSFVAAAPPEVALPLYDTFIRRLRERGLRVETGEFGAMMQVELLNDGPVTLILER